MLTLNDCMSQCDLTEDEIAAIAEHEHLPEIVALELGQYLAHLPKGAATIRRMIHEDISDAQSRSDHLHATKLKLVLRVFDDRRAAGCFR